MHLIKENKPHKKGGFQEEELDGELILSDTDTGQIHILNKTAKVIWSLADGRYTLKEMEKEVKVRFSACSGHDIGRDLERIVGELKEKRLLE